MGIKCQTMEWRVTSPEPRKVYFGLAEEKWRKRYYNHKKVIQPQTIFTRDNRFKLCVASEGKFRCNSSPEIVSSEVSHTLLKHLKKCLLCLYEKLVIISTIQDNTNFLINDWLFSKSHHENKYLLKNFNWFNESLFVKPSQKKN